MANSRRLEDLDPTQWGPGNPPPPPWEYLPVPAPPHLALPPPHPAEFIQFYHQHLQSQQQQVAAAHRYPHQNFFPAQNYYSSPQFHGFVPSPLPATSTLTWHGAFAFGQSSNMSLFAPGPFQTQSRQLSTLSIANAITSLQELHLDPQSSGVAELQTQQNSGAQVQHANHAPPQRFGPPRPSPTQEYLHSAYVEPAMADIPQHVLVVLDLNGTVLFRPNRSRPTHFIPRPGLQRFLSYLFENFDVMIWTSMKEQNSKPLLKGALSQEHLDSLIAVWSRHTFGLNQWEYDSKVQVYKDLTQVWSSGVIQGSSRRRSDTEYFGQHNTILIDDTALKAAAQPFNLLQVPEFTKKEAASGSLHDDVLRKAAVYLSIAKQYKDVSSFIRKYPFDASGPHGNDWPGAIIGNEPSAMEVDASEVNDDGLNEIPGLK